MSEWSRLLWQGQLEQSVAEVILIHGHCPSPRKHLGQGKWRRLSGGAMPVMAKKGRHEYVRKCHRRRQ